VTGATIAVSREMPLSLTSPKRFNMRFPPGFFRFEQPGSTSKCIAIAVQTSAPTAATIIQISVDFSVTYELSNEIVSVFTPIVKTREDLGLPPIERAIGGLSIKAIEDDSPSEEEEVVVVRKKK